MGEEVVGLFDPVELVAMRDERAKINLPSLCPDTSGLVHP
jgi:hypothetical protein